MTNGFLSQLNEHVAAWTELWCDTERHHPDIWKNVDLGEPLWPIQADELAQVCCTYRDNAGLGLDVLNPKLLLSLDGPFMHRAVDLMHKFEEVGELPANWTNLVVFQPKKDGGTRPIGLTCGLMRPWSRVRRNDTTAWEAENDIPEFWGTAGKPCERVA